MLTPVSDRNAKSCGGSDDGGGCSVVVGGGGDGGGDYRQSPRVGLRHLRLTRFRLWLGSSPVIVIFVTQFNIG
jgi:hypothetical protein